MKVGIFCASVVPWFLTPISKSYRVTDQIQVGDRVVVINPYGLRVTAVVEAITEEHGAKLYHVASENFALTVSEKQIAEVHKS